MRSTHTLAILQIPPAAFAEIKARVDRVNERGDYDDMFMDGGKRISLHGLAVEAEPEPTPFYDTAEIVLDALRNPPDDGPNTSFVLRDESECEIGDAKRLIEALAKRGYRVQRVASE